MTELQIVLGVLFCITRCCISVCALIVTLCLHAGAGIYVTHSELSYSSSSLPNNSIILADTGFVNSYSSHTRMSFYCCSNHTTYGTFIGLNDNAYSGRINIQHYSSSDTYAGCMYLHFSKPYHSSSQTMLWTSEQGIYTCRMPDTTGKNIDVSVGIYNEGYSGKSNPCNYSIITHC